MVGKFAFSNYKEAGQDYIGPEGFEELVQDLGYSMDGIEPIILSWLFGCTKMGFVSLSEWDKAFKSLKSSSKKSITSAVDAAKNSLKDPAVFKEFYQWVFSFAKEPNSKSVPSDISSSLYSVIFPTYTHIPQFIDYLNQNDTVKALNRDQWNSLLDFSLTVAPDFSNYDFEGSWPIVFDDFVAYSKK
ncbi:DCN1-like protein 5 [Smittium mucronatum]|uniref:Defective in cullin neddylation protein n=1 Tax=Smittium mucronatum TaxID=133383 RepID=A0A1R0GP29_9FUNG|nr:DCN1-like protein 5 [Smittium mucronatum]